MSLRSRLMLAFAYLLLLAVVALSVPLGVKVARSARSDFAIELTTRAETVAAAVPEAVAAGPQALEDLITADAHIGRVIVVDATGSLVADSTGRRRLGYDYLQREEVVEALEGQTSRLVRDYPNTGRQYVVAVPVIDGGRVVGAVRVNQRVETVDALVRARILGLAAVSLAVLLIGVAVSAGMASSLTRPLRRLASVAGRIGDGELQARADEAGQREVAEVAGALNLMGTRIEQTMAAQTDFVANASHQLRTPLTGLRLRLEALAATGNPSAPAMLAETDRLAGLVNDLLTLVRAGTSPDHVETVDLHHAAVAAVDRWTLPASESGHTLVLRSSGEPLPATMGESDAAIILDNLTENALKYTPAGTTVTIWLDRWESDVVLTFADDGPGMSEADSERAFERFYRGSGKRTPGTGLGLAIVREIARRWGGTVDLDVANGTRIRVAVPAAQPTHAQPAPVAAATTS